MLKILLKKIFFCLYVIRLSPHYLVFKFKCARKDVEALKYIADTRYFINEGDFFRILYKRPEYMSVLYSRLQSADALLRFF